MRSLSASGPLPITWMVAVPSGGAAGAAASVSPAANFQSARKIASMSLTAGPVTVAERSRQRPAKGVGPMYSRARFMPPSTTSRPSTATILRWSRRFAWPRNGTCQTGMKKATRPPADRSGWSSRLLRRHWKSASSSSRTSTPARALRSSLSSTAAPTSSLASTSVETRMECCGGINERKDSGEGLFPRRQQAHRVAGPWHRRPGSAEHPRDRSSPTVPSAGASYSWALVAACLLSLRPPKTR